MHRLKASMLKGAWGFAGRSRSPTVKGKSFALKDLRKARSPKPLIPGMTTIAKVKTNPATSEQGRAERRTAN